VGDFIEERNRAFHELPELAFEQFHLLGNRFLNF
jgi:hypothetical protein